MVGSSSPAGERRRLAVTERVLPRAGLRVPGRSPPPLGIVPALSGRRRRTVRPPRLPRTVSTELHACSMQAPGRLPPDPHHPVLWSLTVRRRGPPPHLWQHANDHRVLLGMCFLLGCLVGPGGDRCLCSPSLPQQLYQTRCHRVPVQRCGSAEFCLCPRSPRSQPCQRDWDTVLLPVALAPASLQSPWQRRHLGDSAFSNQPYSQPPPSPPRVSPSLSRCLQRTQPAWPPGTRCADVWPPTAGCPYTGHSRTAWGG
eukprot:3050800-Rhodomonas_salina.3